MANNPNPHASFFVSRFKDILVHVFVLSIPVLFYPWMTDVTRVKTLIALVVCGTLLSIHVLARNGDSGPICDFQLIYTLYCLWTFFSYQWSVLPTASIDEIIRLSPSLALMLVLPSSTLLQRPATHPSRPLAWIAAIVSAYALIQFAGLDPLIWSKPIGDGVVSFLGHPNALGAFLIIGIAAQIIEIARHPGRVSKHVFGILTITLSLVALGLSMSKGAWMGLVCGVLCYALLLKQRLRLRTMVCFTGGIALAVITLALLSGSFFSELTRSNQFRIETYRQSLRIFSDDFSPLEKLIGKGAGSYAHSFDQFRDPNYLVRFKHAANLEHAHNEPIEILLETGFIGLGLFAWFIYSFIRRGWQNRGDFSIRVWTSACVGLVVHNLVCVNMRWFVPWTFWILAITFIGSSVPRNETATLVHKRIMALIGLLLIPIWIGGAIRTRRHIQADIIYYQSKQALTAGRYDEGTGLLDRAAGLFGDDLVLQYDRAFAHAQAGHTQKSIDLYDSLLRIHPNYQRAHYNQAINHHRLFLTTGSASDLENAIDAINREIRINRNSEMLLYSAQLLEIKGFNEESAGRYIEFVESVIDEIRMEWDRSERNRGELPRVIKSSDSSVRRRQVQDALLKISLYNPSMFIDLRDRVISSNKGNPEILELFQ